MTLFPKRNGAFILPPKTIMSRDEYFAQLTRAALKQLCRMLLSLELLKLKKRAMKPNKRNCITQKRDYNT